MSDASTSSTHRFGAVERVAALLAEEDVRVWLFGGWAEERLGLAPPSAHGDVDYLYLADDFRHLDETIARNGWPLEKELPHKRAVRLHGLTVDLFLVRHDGGSYVSEFGGHIHRWPDDVVADDSRLAVASRASVAEFRRAFERILDEQRREQGAGDDGALGEREVAVVDALVERLLPADELGPGARDAGVLEYVERALATAYRRHLDAYRTGVALVEEYARATRGQGFCDLGAADQDEIVAWLETSAAGFFDLLLQHVREGMFGDPSWGGNRDGAGWALLGYPGPRRVWTAEDQRLDVQPEPSA